MTRLSFRQQTHLAREAAKLVQGAREASDLQWLDQPPAAPLAQADITIGVSLSLTGPGSGFDKTECTEITSLVFISS